VRNIQDERIITEKRRINSSAFGICFLALWSILMYRQFILQQNIMEYIDIFFLTIGLSIYITASNVFRGYYLTYRSKKSRKRINLLSALIGSLTFVIVHYFVMGYNLTNWEDIVKLLASLIIFFIFWITAQSILISISEAKANEDIDID